MHTIYSDKRKSGIPLIGDLPWGSHFCQFYQTKNDLLEIFIPYVKAGLENNELCVLVASEQLEADKAKKALKKAIPDFEKYAAAGQVEIIPSSRCHAAKGQGAKDKGQRGDKPGKIIASLLDKAIVSGFEGFRLAYSALPEKEDGRVVACGADAISKYNAIAVFAYPRDSFDAIGLLEVVKNHRFALLKNAGKWEVLESSEARTIKDALKRSEEKLQSLFSNMSEGFAYHRIVLDAKGTPCDYIFLEINESFEKLTGLKGKDIIGKKVTEALPGIEKDPTDWIGKYGEVALTGKHMQFESYSEALDKWYSVSAFSPHKGYFAVTFRDITERKQYEEELVRAKQEWERTFDSVPDLIAILDNEHRIVRANRAMAERLGRKADQCVGLKCFTCVHGSSIPPEVCPHTLTMKDGMEHTAELQEDRLGGFFLVTTTPLFDAAGKMTGSVHVARDITERKRAEELRERLLEDLMRSNTELEQFAYIASHDLQEPLRMISSYVELISHRYRGNLDSDADDFIGYMVNGTSHMKALLDDLLAYSRVGRPGKPLQTTALDGALDLAIMNLRSSIDENHALITREDLPTVPADKVQISRVFQNLIANALKFRSNEPPRIHVSASQDDNECTVRVRDNGIGIDPKYYDKLFIIFKRLHTRDEYPGTGIGLAICKKIVERHGGKIWVDSEGPGKGSTFCFTIKRQVTGNGP